MSTVKQISVLCNPEFSESLEEWLQTNYCEKLSTPIEFVTPESIYIYDTQLLKSFVREGAFDGKEDSAFDYTMTDKEKDIILSCDTKWIALESHGSL